MSSADLSGWTSPKPYLARAPAWAKRPGFGGAPGAPVQLLSGSWMMTFQAESRGCDRNVCTCVGAAFAPHPAGPFDPAPEPLTCMPEHDGAIDSSPRRLAAADGGGLALCVCQRAGPA